MTDVRSVLQEVEEEKVTQLPGAAAAAPRPRGSAPQSPAPRALAPAAEAAEAVLEEEDDEGPPPLPLPLAAEGLLSDTDMLAMEQELEEVAAVNIQSMARGRKARQEQAATETAAVNIQSWVRGNRARAQVLEMSFQDDMNKGEGFGDC